MHVQKIAEEMLRFHNDTLKLVQRKGKLYPADDLVLSEANEETVIEARSLKDVSGVSFFTTGPVYVGAQVPYSFLDQYCGERNADTQFLTFQTPAPIAKDLDVLNDAFQVVGTWNDKIHAVDENQLADFTDFMCEQILMRDNLAFGVMSKDLMINDPVLASRGVTDYLKVRVFSIYTRRAVFEPYVDLKSTNIAIGTRVPTQAMVDRLGAAMKAKAQGVANGG